MGLFYWGLLGVCELDALQLDEGRAWGRMWDQYGEAEFGAGGREPSRVSIRDWPLSDDHLPHSTNVAFLDFFFEGGSCSFVVYESPNAGTYLAAMTKRNNEERGGADGARWAVKLYANEGIFSDEMITSEGGLKDVAWRSFLDALFAQSPGARALLEGATKKSRVLRMEVLTKAYPRVPGFIPIRRKGEPQLVHALVSGSSEWEIYGGGRGGRVEEIIDISSY